MKKYSLMVIGSFLVGSTSYAAKYECMVKYGDESGITTVIKNDPSEGGTVVTIGEAVTTASIFINSSLDPQYQDIKVFFENGSSLSGMTASNQKEFVLVGKTAGNSIGINCELK